MVRGLVKAGLYQTSPKGRGSLHPRGPEEGEEGGGSVKNVLEQK